MIQTQMQYKVIIGFRGKKSQYCNVGRERCFPLSEDEDLKACKEKKIK